MSHPPAPCCTPSRGTAAPLLPAPAPPPRAGGSTDGMVLLPGGEFLMGTEDDAGFPGDGEGPVRRVRLDPFLIDTRAVSNEQFAAFVADTGYRTEAERLGWSYVFAGFLPAALRRTAARVERTPWWCAVAGAAWDRPEGGGSDVADRGDHPVVHISWHDADAYARWAGKRLPTEAEWEYAARGGLEQARYPWGDELDPGGTYRCNIWRGTFPSRNTAADGYRGTAPVDAFEPNGYGLYNTAGNVWEWCADWWTTDHPVARPLSNISSPSSPGTPSSLSNPSGPAGGTAKVIRGGSHLCHRSYCNRYRVAARSANTPDSSSGHAGFRCARTATRSARLTVVATLPR
ncbi:formylglycine-generating enzyme family protein [Kitasatospora sp. NBC_01287]|uniref:formylglycine-generating enzyme family protein n=1 Tax=Kitasatospora sp. NBC_01287 TaxID=2903573 RepID=UPI0022564027|nr:formylglycine-generating enzyme family protein [Kitasatospora sp. NBC_01287]MCX4744040.1 formylglycine-generating enzyme family protein [Kitasatospora sp. NBC_01287]